MDVMLDIETLDVLPSAVVLTFGALKFNVFDDTIYDDGLYLRIDVDEQITSGRTINESTIEWWGRQTPEVRDEALGDEGRISMLEFTKQLNKFLVGADRVWAQGPAFDMVIIEDLYRTIKVPCPWHYYQIRDSRTILKALGDDRLPGREAAHNALADCYYQARAVQTAFSKHDLKTA